LRSFPSDDDSDSGSNAGGTLWAISDNTNSTIGTWQTTPPSDRRRSLPRLVVDSGVPQVPPQKSSGPTPLPQVPPFLPPEFPPAIRRPPKPPTKPPSSFPMHRTSVFNEDFRPPAEEMYERLGDFFPGHDLDEPMIEASSGGTSPTSAEATQPFSIPDRRKHKKSIRVVANEHKRRLDRTSRITSANNVNMMRKRSTKFWGSRVEEVTPEQFRNASSTLSTPAESPSEPKRAFYTGCPGWF
jgi:mitogen-activated protein kinase kinase kinase